VKIEYIGRIRGWLTISSHLLGSSNASRRARVAGNFRGFAASLSTFSVKGRQKFR
jgi:hypothetical protein